MGDQELKILANIYEKEANLKEVDMLIDSMRKEKIFNDPNILENIESTFDHIAEAQEDLEYQLKMVKDEIAYVDEDFCDDLKELPSWDGLKNEFGNFMDLANETAKYAHREVNCDLNQEIRFLKVKFYYLATIFVEKKC